jgi:hypothetical protein
MFIYWGLLIAGMVAFWFFSMRDYSSSMLQNSHGLYENDILKINRDKYGYFSPRNFWIAHLIYFAAAVAICLIFFVWEKDKSDEKIILMAFIMLFFLPASIGSGVIAWRNNKKAKYSREKVQIPLMERLAAMDTYDEDQVREIFRPVNDGKPFRIYGGRVRSVPFPFYYSDKDQAQYEVAFYRAIWERARGGRNQWFTNTDFIKVA